jgi:hypothetical protein
MYPEWKNLIEEAEKWSYGDQMKRQADAGSLGGVGGIGIGGRYLVLLMHRLFGGIPLLQFDQVLAHGLVHLRRFRQLLAWNPALLRCIGFYKTAIDREVLTLHQSHFHTLAHDLRKQLLEQLRFLKPSMPAFGERGVMWNLLIEAQTVNQRHATCIRNSSTGLRSLVMPYR